MRFVTIVFYLLLSCATTAQTFYYDTTMVGSDTHLDFYRGLGVNKSHIKSYYENFVSATSDSNIYNIDTLTLVGHATSKWAIDWYPGETVNGTTQIVSLTLSLGGTPRFVYHSLGNDIITVIDQNNSIPLPLLPTQPLHYNLENQITVEIIGQINGSMLLIYGDPPYREPVIADPGRQDSVDIIAEPPLPTNVFEYDLQSEYVYPNPVTEGILYIKTSEEVKSASIYNMLGRLVLDLSPKNGPANDVSTLESGNYIITVRTTTHQFSRKIIINH